MTKQVISLGKDKFEKFISALGVLVNELTIKGVLECLKTT